MRAILLLLLLVPAPLTVLRGGHVSEGDERNPAVYPPQRIDIDFVHAAHLDEVGLECSDCHAVASSSSVKDYNIPARDTCLECHDSAEVPQTWGPKHRKETNAVALPPAHLKFAHDAHLALEGVDCATCHAGVESARLATVEHLPSMETCLSCHDGAQAPGDCSTCHLAGRGGTIRTAFASGELVPDDHGLHWLKQHELAAERDIATCAACHEQNDCLECHEGSVPPDFHDGNYLAQHPRDAYANNPTCGSCHRIDSFCESCHFKAGVTAFDVIPFQGFHPPGWADFPGPMGELPTTHHSRMARKNINSCTACHEQDFCSGCHAWYVGAPRTHGPGWKDSERRRRLERENPGLCMQCHTSAPDDPINQP